MKITAYTIAQQDAYGIHLLPRRLYPPVLDYYEALKDLRPISVRYAISGLIVVPVAVDKSEMFHVKH